MSCLPIAHCVIKKQPVTSAPVHSTECLFIEPLTCRPTITVEPEPTVSEALQPDVYCCVSVSVHLATA